MSPATTPHSPTTRPGQPVRTGQNAAPAKRRKHLMDPNAPRPVRNAAEEERNLSRVQKWVLSTLAVTTILHLTVGLVLAAMYVAEPTPSSEIGLNIIAGFTAVIAVAVWRAIHGKSIVSPWLLLGVIPGAIGLWLTIG